MLQKEVAEEKELPKIKHRGGKDRSVVYKIPPEVRPVMMKYKVEVCTVLVITHL